MVFTSALFLFAFLPTALLLSYATRRSTTAQNAVLLALSLLFYAWGEPIHIVLLVACVLLTYATGHAMARSGSARAARLWLALGVTLNLGLLLYFKYAHMLVQALVAVAQPSRATGFGPVHLPIGLSFFIFQAISYLVDLRRGDAKPAPTPFRVALYIALFPQLLAGPIVRYADVDAQLDARHADLSDVADGLRRFATGLAKKALVADPLAAVADVCFDTQLGPHSSGVAWLGAAYFTLQIYFDFSGYSDMAIGLGRVFGLRFRENFDFPYRADSVREFWHRWHISLSTWFRDYLYIPLGGSRLGPFRTVLNLWTVFLLCGLWHGANATFLAWGAWHGALLSLERLVQWRPPRIVGHLYTMLAVVVGFAVFRCASLYDASRYLSVMFGAAPTGELGPELSALLERHTVGLALLGTGLALDLPRRLQARLHPGLRAWAGWGPLADAATLLALFACGATVAATTYRPFVYFRF